MMNEFFEEPGLVPTNGEVSPSQEWPDMAPDQLFPNVILPEEEQKAIVEICNRFKKSARAHARQKKEVMRTCYAYAKNKFVGDDLLPLPSTQGNDRDNKSGRPQVFVPLTRQQVKTIYAQLKLTLFPNDQDYFRVRGKTPEAALLEDSLTEGLKYKFKEALISEKIGASLYNLVWAGCFATFPAIRDEVVWEWSFDPVERQYVPRQVDTPPMPDLETFNPIQFYIDPTAQDPERAKWVYVGRKKAQEIKDSNLYFNKERLASLSNKNVSDNAREYSLSLSDFNDLGNLFEDSEDNVEYDLYYFPHLKTPRAEYRNMIVGVAGNRLLVRFHPNTFPKGMNPVVFCGWGYDPENPYSVGPVEDIKDLQKLVNILYNYMIEVAARSGNRFAVGPDVDISNLFGLAGGIAVTPNPGRDIVPLHGDFAEIGVLQNMIGVAKAEAQVTAGSQTPFQGSSNIDFKKTATEMQILQENGISILREVIEHVSIMGVQRVLERLMYLCADLYAEPVLIALDNDPLGRRYRTVDFSVLKSGQFSIELVSVNPSQSKQAQVNGLVQLLGMIGDNPDTMLIGEPIILKIGELYGIKDTRGLLNEIKERMRAIDGNPKPEPPNLSVQPGFVPGAAGVPAPQGGLGTVAIKGLAGDSKAPIGGQGPIQPPQANSQPG